MEEKNRQINIFRQEVHDVCGQMTEFSLPGETILEREDEDLERYHVRRLANLANNWSIYNKNIIFVARQVLFRVMLNKTKCRTLLVYKSLFVKPENFANYKLLAKKEINNVLSSETKMIQKELSLLFPPVSYKDGLLLLVSPDRFYKLEGNIIERCRLHILVCEGILELEMNGTPYEIKGPALLDVMDTVAVRISKTSANLRAWCLFITFEFASESLKNLRPGPLNHLLERLHLPVWNLSQEESGTLERQLLLLKEILGNPKHYYQQELSETYFRSFSLELGNIMFTHEENMDNTPPYISKRDFVTLNFMKLISKHFMEEHNIDFYAKALCISTKHLTRIVKEMTGKTPHTLICNELLHQAMVMLEDDSIPVSQIAEKLHFSDQAAFCKFFKKLKKVPPMAYRRRINK